jgi:hypothetical protein
MHRALTHFRLGPMNLVTAIFLFLFFSMGWLVLLPRLCTLWKRIFADGLRLLPLHAELALSQHCRWSWLSLEIPYFRMEPILPSLQTWMLVGLATLLLFGTTFLLPEKLTPIIYLLRGTLLVQASALVYFAVWPARFPHTPDSYMEGLVSSGLALISTIPLLFGLTYYILDFGMVRKALLTILTMTHLALFLPLQVLLQALVLQKTVLFMPLLYIIFGMPLDVLLIIAFYSWGMTWSFRNARSS